MKKILTLFVLSIWAVIGAMATDVYTVVGVEQLGLDWDQQAETHMMTVNENHLFTYTSTACTLQQGTKYEYKIVKNHSWTTAYPQQGNYKFEVTETAKYNVTFTFDPTKQTANVTTTKVGESGPIVHTYTVAGSPLSLFSTLWDAKNTSNDMTKIEEDLYQLNKKNINITATDFSKDKIAFKICTDHSWTDAQPQKNWNLYYLIPGPGTYHFEFTYKPKNKKISAMVYNEVTVPEAGYTTGALSIISNPTKYECTPYAVKVKNGEVVLQAIYKEAPVGTPFLFQAQPGTYKIEAYSTDNPTTPVDTDLKLSDGSINGDGKTIYALAKKAQGTGFYLVASNVNIPAGKGYIQLSNTAGAKNFLPFNSSTTTIQELTTTPSTTNRGVYNLAGQRVGRTFKGLVISNGKKFIQK